MVVYSWLENSPSSWLRTISRRMPQSGERGLLVFAITCQVSVFGHRSSHSTRSPALPWTFLFAKSDEFPVERARPSSTPLDWYKRASKPRTNGAVKQSQGADAPQKTRLMSAVSQSAVALLTIPDKQWNGISRQYEQARN